jgi:tRNA dimethylallyltransferase
VNKVLVIIGPTAVGKTAISINLAQRYHGEIISGDSVQVYRELNIGSAKVSIAEQQGIKHHLLNICGITDNYTVYDFQQQGRVLIEQIANAGKLPMIVGGTGLYIKALLHDYHFPQTEHNKPDYHHLSNAELWNLINDIDPTAATKIHINNRQRLETNYYLLQQLNNSNKSEMLAQQKQHMLYDALIIGLTMDRDRLYERINHRVDLMIEAGLEEEICGLLKIANIFSQQGMQAIGYKEWEAYFLGNETLEKTVETIKQHTRHFAKRQYTWFRNQMDVKWVNVSEDDCAQQIDSLINEWLKK